MKLIDIMYMLDLVNVVILSGFWYGILMIREMRQEARERSRILKDLREHITEISNHHAPKEELKEIAPEFQEHVDIIEEVDLSEHLINENDV